MRAPRAISASTANVDLAIAIRTGVVKDKTLYVQAAAGIVADSIPENEWRETQEQGTRAARGGGTVHAGLDAPAQVGSAIMLLMIDNYDSFTYNLVQYLGELGEDVKVVRNDELTVDEIEGLAPDCIVLSPGAMHAERSGRLS